MQRIAKPSGIRSANENVPWAEFYPQAEALIRQRFGRFNMDTMFGADTCRLGVASTLWLLENKMMTPESAEKTIERAYKSFAWKMDYAKEVGWRPHLEEVK